jgi:hypothetical protein
MILWRHPGKNVFESKSWFRFIRIHSLKHTDIFLPREIWPSSKTDAPEENSFWLWGLDAPVSRTNHVLPAAPFVSVFNYVSFVYLSFWIVLGPCCTEVINACTSTRLNSTWRKNLFCTLIFLTWTPKWNEYTNSFNISLCSDRKKIWSCFQPASQDCKFMPPICVN